MYAASFFAILLAPLALAANNHPHGQGEPGHHKVHTSTHPAHHQSSIGAKHGTNSSTKRRNTPRHTQQQKALPTSHHQGISHQVSMEPHANPHPSQDTHATQKRRGSSHPSRHTKIEQKHNSANEHSQGHPSVISHPAHSAGHAKSTHEDKTQFPSSRQKTPTPFQEAETTPLPTRQNGRPAKPVRAKSISKLGSISEDKAQGQKITDAAPTHPQERQPTGPLSSPNRLASMRHHSKNEGKPRKKTQRHGPKDFVITNANGKTKVTSASKRATSVQGTGHAGPHHH